MSRAVFDTFKLQFDVNAFASGKTNWKDFYGDTKEELPMGMP